MRSEVEMSGEAGKKDKLERIVVFIRAGNDSDFHSSRFAIIQTLRASGIPISPNWELENGTLTRYDIPDELGQVKYIWQEDL